MNKRVESALAAHKKTAIEIIKSVEAAYPIGAVVYVSIGRSAFPAQIESHNQFWWANPGEMTGTNLITGKVRRFSPINICPAAPGEEENDQGSGR